MNTISFEKEISRAIIEKNAENFDMAHLNLSDFNRRMDKDYDLICRFTNENPRFFLRQELRYPENTNTIASQINWFLMWKNSQDQKSYFRMFFSDVRREFEAITFYHSPHVQKDNVYFKLADNFKKKYTDYAPLGFLSTDEENYIKEEINIKFLRNL
ncbi:hypothetical protein ASG31_05425 [Chryseobacterium sp. Leaf404]|uniref:hypothetical protein n=1 Tax=unclassified Chryseobacterium TaxID=2593645 RepID=UPI0006F22AC8|nr:MULTISPECIES: hypothetical protein [unclassified Chryseobacterium]KQT18174.1 hypothetical protein ASG31_05425 [Chryseobacterium sp. Leaf404]